MGKHRNHIYSISGTDTAAFAPLWAFPAGHAREGGITGANDGFVIPDCPLKWRCG